MSNITTFFREVRTEMSKVVWPTGTQLVAYTLVVIFLSAVLSIFLGLLDLGFQKLLTNYILR